MRLCLWPIANLSANTSLMISLIRLRAPATTRRTRSAEALLRLVKAAFGPDVADPVVTEFQLSPTSSDPEREISDLASLLEDIARRASGVVLDLQYGYRSTRPLLLEDRITQAIELADIANSRKQPWVVLVEDIEAVDTVRLLAELGADKEQPVVILDSSGGHVGSGADQDTLAESFRWTEDELIELVRSMAFRRRGVFSVVPEQGEPRLTDRLYTFLAEHGATRYLEALMVRHLQTTRPAVVLFDDESSEWLASVVQAACLRSGLEGHPVEYFGTSTLSDKDQSEEGQVQRDRATAALARQGSSVLVVVTLVRTRSRLVELLSALPPTLADVSAMAIFYDRDEYTGLPRSAGMFPEIKIPPGPDWCRTYALVPVEFGDLAADSWIRRATEANPGWCESTAEDWSLPTPASVWLLLQHYAGSQGDELGYRGSWKSGDVQLKLKLELLDSFWLAEALVSLSEAEWGLERAHLLIVVPNDDSSAAQAIAGAAEALLEVPVLVVERAWLDDFSSMPAGARHMLQGYKPRGITLIDESSVSGETLSKLHGLVRHWAVGAKIRSVVAFDLAQNREPGDVAVEGGSLTIRSLMALRPLVGGTSG